MHMSQMSPITVIKPEISCDGDGVALGHPRIFLKVRPNTGTRCPYCGKHYILDDKAASAPNGH